ncbi:ABC transporter substrate-binding protein [Saccharopolyspora sp. NPDC047091]|uniref:peptide ABC transporter substrate-binding protein n=1 Tax=Saccharopolyspora sp. NPDC047091 TaxID=3155924 RepID=UPI0033F088B3
MRKGRLAAMLAAPLAVALLASGCGGGGNSASADTVTVEWGEPENPLIPGNTTEVNGGNVIDSIFSGLVKYSPDDASVSNEMAEEITPSADNRTFTIKIKPGWTFHDGSPVTAESFVKAWNYTAYAPNGQQGASFFEQVKGYDQVNPADPDGASGPKEAPKPTAETMSGLKVLDPNTFQVELKSPLAIFPTMLGYSAFYPLPEMFYTNKQGFEDRPIGNGPFKFESRSPNENLTVSRYDDFKGDDKAKVRAVEFKVYDELDTAYQDLVSGNLDFIRQVPVSALTGDKWRTDLGEGAQEKPGLLTQNIAFPLYDERFKNPDLRKAISMAIDRPTITQQIFAGSRQPADGWTSPSVEGFVPGQCGEYCTFDPEKAKQLLAKAGGFQGTLTIITNGDGGHNEWSEAVASSIRQNLGLDVQFTPTPTFSEFRRQANAREFTGMYRTGWVADYPNIETFLTQLYRTGASSNDGEYSNPAFDAALDKANAAPNVEAANKLYADAEKLLAQDMPVIPLWTQPVQAGYSTERLAEAKATPFRKLDLTSVTLKQQ